MKSVSLVAVGIALSSGSAYATARASDPSLSPKHKGWNVLRAERVRRLSESAAQYAAALAAIP